MPAFDVVGAVSLVSPAFSSCFYSALYCTGAGTVTSAKKGFMTFDQTFGFLHHRLIVIDSHVRIVHKHSTGGFLHHH